MGRVVASLNFLGLFYMVLGLWKFDNIEDAVRKVDELWEKYSNGDELKEKYSVDYECSRDDILRFECRVGGKQLLVVSWLPDGREDIEQLIQLKNREWGGGVEV